MKSLKKYFQVILCFMAFAVASFLFAFAPSVGSYAALNTTKDSYNMAIKAVKMPRSTYVDSEGKQFLHVPFLKGNWQYTAKYTIRVVDVDGVTTHDYKVGAASGEETSAADANYFTKIKINGDAIVKSTDAGYSAATGDEYLSISSLNNGYYKIMYIVEENSKLYYSAPTTIKVENAKYEFDYTIQSGDKKGLKVLVPETVKKSNSEDAKIELPVAYIKNTKTKTVLDGVTANIKVFNDLGTVLDASSGIIQVENGVTYFKPTTTGKYTIEYSYNYGKKLPEQITIEVKDDFTAPTSEDLTIKAPSLDSVELGQKDVVLKDVVVNSKSKDNISKNIESIVITNGTLTATLKNNNRKFSMVPATFGREKYTEDMLGSWDVTYNIVDAYGNKKSKTVSLGNVKNTKLPTVYMAYDYDTTNAETMKNLEKNASAINATIASEFKSELGYNELYFPAIYATDDVTSYEDFVFVRYIAKTNTNTSLPENRYYIDNVMIKDGERHVISYSETTYRKNLNKTLIEGSTVNAGANNKAVKFEFNVEDASSMAGEYVLGYEVYAKDITKQTGVYKIDNSLLKFTILSTALREEASNVDHKVEISNISDGETIESNGKLEVKVSASETKRTTSAGESTEKVDKRLKNAVFYYYTTSSTDLQTDLDNAFELAAQARTTHYGTEHIFDSAKFIEIMKDKYNGFAYATLNDSKNYELTLKNYDNFGGGYVNIVAISVDDDAHIAYAKKTLAIKDINNTTAPEFEKIENAHSFEVANLTTDVVVKRGTTVTLPDVSFVDDDKTLAMNVYYYRATDDNKMPTEYLSTNNMRLYNNYLGLGKSRIEGGTILADTVGTYHVVYSATDDAGNTTFVYFTFTVVLETKPTFDVTMTGAKPEGSIINCESGTQIKFNPVVKDNDGNVLSTGYAYAYVEGKGYSTGADENSFVFNSQGTFVVKFVATYTEGGVAQTVETDGFAYTVNVTAPELKWDDEDFDASSFAYKPKNSVVTLPKLTASRGTEQATVEVSVKFKGDKIAVSQNSDFSAWQFETGNVTGDYEVEYTASIGSSTKLTKTFKIKVGDNVAPTINIDHEDELAQDITYDGSTNIEYTINLVPRKTSSRERKLEIVISNGDNKQTYNTNLVLKDRDETGTIKEISWDNLEVVLKNGNSTMSASSTDTYSKTYTISATGSYKLVITAKDDNGNTQTKEIEFNVKSETKVEKQKDTVVGVVLIVLSLVILAGVILFFTFTGKGKGGSNKSKAVKQPKAKQDNSKETATLEVKDEVAESADQAQAANDEAKTGDVE